MYCLNHFVAPMLSSPVNVRNTGNASDFSEPKALKTDPVSLIPDTMDQRPFTKLCMMSQGKGSTRLYEPKRLWSQSRVWCQATVMNEKSINKLQYGYYKEEMETQFQSLQLFYQHDSPSSSWSMVRCQCKTTFSTNGCSSRNTNLPCTEHYLCDTECKNDEACNTEKADGDDEADGL